MTDFEVNNPKFAGFQKNLLIAGIVGIGVSCGLAIMDSDKFFQGYLLAFLFWNGLALGCLSVLMLHHIVAGAWGFVTQRIVEAGSRNIFWMPILFLPMFYPLFTGDVHVWPWTNAEYVEAHPIVGEKTDKYLNVPFFLARWVLYYAIWLGLAYCLNGWSKQCDDTGNPELTLKMRKLSAIGLVLYVLSVTFAATDWGMSIEPEWFSTIYPPIHIAGYGLCALVFSIIMLAMLSKTRPHADVMSVDYFHHLGGLTLGITIVWSYFSFSQFLITWSGNLPEEIGFFLHRTDDTLIAWAVVLILFHFAIPLLFLLQKVVKRSLKWLVGFASLIFVMRFMDLTYLVKPSFYENHNQFPLTLVDITLFLGIGGIWLSRFFAELQKRPVLPLNDQRMSDALAHGLVGGSHGHDHEGTEHA